MLWGAGTDSSIVTASFKAVLSAVNRRFPFFGRCWLVAGRFSTSRCFFLNNFLRVGGEVRVKVDAGSCR